MKKLLFIFAFVLATVANAQITLTPQQISAIFPEQTISRHPDPHLKSIIRTVQLGGLSFCRITGQQTVQVLYIVKHYDSTGTYIPNVVDDLPITLTADVNHYINPNVPTYPRVTADSTGAYPSTSVREWDAWVMLFSQPQNIFQTIMSQVAAADANGEFNNYPGGQTIKVD